MKVYLYVDDLRESPKAPDDMNVVVVTARDYSSAVNILRYCNEKNWDVFIDLDHDLGIGKTGYDIAKFIVENHFPLLGYDLHSMNPVGVQNMEQLLSHYGYTRSKFF